MTRRGQRGPAALTLVEVVAALAVTALLAAGAATATRALVRTRSAVVEPARRDRLAGDLRRLLELDLANARRYRCRDSALELEGLTALEGDRLRLAHRPATVAYRPVLEQDAWYLVRVQRTGSGEPTAGLVLRGARSIELRMACQKEQPRDWQVLPDAAAVRVEMDDGTKDKSLEMVLVLR